MGRLRHVQIIHKYSIEVPPESFDDPEFDTLCNSAMSMMEGHMQRLNPNMKDLTTRWERMPVEYEPIEDTPQRGTIHRGRNIGAEEAMYRGGRVTFVDDVMGGVGGVMHPHDQGLRFFPPDHPFYDAETEVIEAEVIREDEDEEPKELEP